MYILPHLLLWSRIYISLPKNDCRKQFNMLKNMPHMQCTFSCHVFGLSSLRCQKYRYIWYHIRYFKLIYELYFCTVCTIKLCLIQINGAYWEIKAFTVFAHGWQNHRESVNLILNKTYQTNKCSKLRPPKCQLIVIINKLNMNHATCFEKADVWTKRRALYTTAYI